MKPKNFLMRKLRRKAVAKKGESLTSTEHKALMQPKDIRIRIGFARRSSAA